MERRIAGTDPFLEGPVQVEGVRARALIRQPQDLPLWAALAIGVEIAAALEHTHEHGSVHGQVTPDNILIDEQGQASLVAVGPAPGYATAASDVFGLSRTVYELCTGILPEERAVPEPSSYRPEIPEPVDAVLLQSLELDPSVRPSAGELRAALAGALAGLRPEGEPGLALRDWIQRQPPAAAPDDRPRARQPFEPRTDSESSPAVEPHFTGEVFQETYCLERLIGKGGMGVVYEASHRRLSRRFAVKLLYPELASNPDALARFEREAQITGRLGHPHIVEVVDFNRTRDGRPYIVMELLVGEDLAERLDRTGRRPLAEAVEIVRQTASALQAVHEIGVVHRDLKPHNIFLCHEEDGDRVKVVDFGVSKIPHPGRAMTQAGALVGTPFYMAPEQAQKQAEVDGRADIYALGAILYRTLTGRPPFEAESIPALLERIIHDPLRPLRSLRPDIPERVAQVVERALSKNREDRYPSMRVFWRELGEAADHPTLVLARSASGARQLPRPSGPLAATLPPEPTDEPNLPRPRPAAVPAVARHRLRLVLVAALAAGLAAAAIVVALRAPSGTTAGAVADARAPGRADLRPRAPDRPQPGRDQQPPDASSALPADGRPRGPLPAELTLSTVEDDESFVPARFSLDGEERGQTPARVIGLRARAYRLVVEAPGFRRVQRRLVLRPGRNPVKIRLTR
jgi:eukaryotic-like serine/threonine-protein kinase